MFFLKARFDFTYDFVSLADQMLPQQLLMAKVSGLKANTGES